jgi:hypothetical protein
MMYKYIFVYIVLLLIIIKLIDFLSETFFPYFFHVHLNILDKVVSSLYAHFGTACINKLNTIQSRLQIKTKNFRCSGILE